MPLGQIKENKMSQYAVIAQNDESQWDDIKGELYHYPSTYKSILTKGCKIIYYKGLLKNKKYEKERLSNKPHYFGIGVIGDSIPDDNSTKNDIYCEILDYQEFKKAIPAKINGEYLEFIPESKKSNYWRFGVRGISGDVYQKIINSSTTIPYIPRLPSESSDFESSDTTEGKKKLRYSSYYERNPINREKAIEIHGLTCMACRFNFEAEYGQHGKGFIHVHHIKPLNETGETLVDPKTDLIPLCPNCHAMVHKNKNHTLSLNELKELLK